MEALNNLFKNYARPTSSRAANVPLRFSEWSSPAVRDSGWACQDLMLGAGMVIIQPSTNRVVVVDEVITVDVEVQDGGNATANAQVKGKGKANVGAKRETRSMTYKRRSFLPRGRKDKNESVEHAALREAFEEVSLLIFSVLLFASSSLICCFYAQSGYEVSPFPLYTWNRQPPSPHDEDAASRPNTEAVYHTMHSWGPRYHHDQCIDHGGEYLVAWFVGQIPENPVCRLLFSAFKP
jgi:8-oxo-dGTP pyrophosphatase MutT (NUDIX family)